MGSLEVLAHAVATSGIAPGTLVVPVVDARRGEVFVARLRGRPPSGAVVGGSPSERRSPEALAAELGGLGEPIVVAGNGARRYRDDAGRRARCGVRRASPSTSLLRVSWPRWWWPGPRRGRPPTSGAVLPHYLRDAETRINWETRVAPCPLRSAEWHRRGTTRARPSRRRRPTPRPTRAAWPEAVRIMPLRRRHLRTVVQIEEANYPRPWTSTVFLSELAQRRSRRYTVATIGPLVVGFSGLMIVAEDGHITTLTVDPAWHRRSIGTVLLLDQARAAPALGVRHLTLEVRASNTPAQALYQRFGFAPVGVRRNYYPETRRGRHRHVGARHRHRRLRAASGRHRRPSRFRSMTGADALVLGIETSCDDTAAAVVDGGTEVLSSVVSSQVDLHAIYGGVVPELAGRAHLELLTPVIAEALRAGRGGGQGPRTPWPPPSAPASSARCSWG